VTAAANTEALEELKSMFTTYMEKIKDKEEGNPSMSKDLVEDRVPIYSTNKE
jgi:hypothetical protein